MIGPTASYYEDPAQYLAPDCYDTPADLMVDWLQSATAEQLYTLVDQIIDGKFVGPMDYKRFLELVK